MDISNSRLGQIKKIVRRWTRHVIYVFVAIVIVFFNLSFAKIIEELTVDSGLTGYPKLWEQFLMALPSATKPIVFLLIPIFICLILYTIYTIIRITKRIPYQSINNRSICFYYFLLAFFNSGFVALICLIGIHCLQAKNTNVSTLLLQNFSFQLLIISYSIIFLDIRKIVYKRIVSVIICSIILIILINCNKIWVHEIIKPAVVDLINRFLQVRS